MFEVYNCKGSNDTFDHHHGQITQKDQPCRGHKTFICERKPGPSKYLRSEQR